VLVADCTTALRKMNVEDWRGEHDLWFELLMGCKYVGITLSDFVEWCVSDPHYADHAEIIERKWHSVEPKHGGAFWRELSKRKIRIGGKGDNLFAGVPLTKAEPNSQPNLRRADARINAAISAIDSDPTERCLFWASCLWGRFSDANRTIKRERTIKRNRPINLPKTSRAYPQQGPPSLRTQ
jgi:hypothetical protein